MLEPPLTRRMFGADKTIYLRNATGVYSLGNVNPSTLARSTRVNASTIFEEYLLKYVVDHSFFDDTLHFEDQRRSVLDVIGGTFPNVLPLPPPSLIFFKATNWLTNFASCRKQVLRYLRINGQDVWCNFGWSVDLRRSPSEVIITSLDDGANMMVLENIAFAQGQALVNITQVSFIIVLLGGASLLFVRDARHLVIEPLEKMASLVRRLSANPLARIEEAQEGEYETDFVESALKKFGKLLQIAFGEAGSEIIAKNLSADGELDPMVAGKYFLVLCCSRPKENAGHLRVLRHSKLHGLHGVSAGGRDGVCQSHR